MQPAQVIETALFGLEIEVAKRRRAAAAALDRATQAIVRLDTIVSDHPLRLLWRRHEEVFGLAQAVAEGGAGGSAADVVRLLVVAHRPHDAELKAAVDDRRCRWAGLQERSEGHALRRVVKQLSENRARRAGLLDLAEATCSAIAACTAIAVELTIDDTARSASVRAYGHEGIDAGDVALATPIALRRIGLTRSRLPSLTGRPRMLAADLPVLERVRRWAEHMETQAHAALARLQALERYSAQVDQHLQGQRRPHALRRAIELTLWHGRIWAAELARLADVDIANAWRCLRQAEEMGLLVAVPGPAGRGGGRLLTVPLLLRAAGELPANVSWRQAAVSVPTPGAVAELDRALAEVDALLARLPLDIQNDGAS